MSGYGAFLRQVEPGLPRRLHRFARPAEALTAAGGATPMEVVHSPAGVGPGEGDWVLVVEPGARLRSDAVEQFRDAAAQASGAEVITCDHDRIGRLGRRSGPRLHGGPSPDFLQSGRCEFPAVAVRRAALGQGEAGEDWLRRLLGRVGPDRHAHLPAILVHRRGRRPAAPPPGPTHPLVGEPEVEVIVCLRDGEAMLTRCARSLLDRTAYPRVRLRLMDNGSQEPGVLRELDALARDDRVTVERDPRPFNFSLLNHAPARRSGADVLVFLNNDTEINDPRWIETLLAQAVRPEVGAVAPMLLYPDGRVQHAGVAIGIHGWAGHPFAGLKPDERTPFGAATDGTRNWMAVTAACLMVERRKYLEVGGFDPAFQVGGGDVDLCLRLTAAGYRSLCVPATTVIHDESGTRDPAKVPPGDFEASRRSYGAFRTVGDPFYHPALTLQDTTCRLRGPGEPDPPA